MNHFKRFVFSQASIWGVLISGCNQQTDMVLESRDSNNAEQVKILIVELQSDDAPDRLRAAKSLGELGQESATASIHLIATLSDSNELVRNAARESLFLIGKPAHPYLVDALGEHDTVATVSEVLVLIGEPAIPALIAALKRPSVATDAAQVLERIGKLSTPYLIAALKDDKTYQQSAAILTQFGEEVVPALATALMLDGTSQVTRRRIVLILQELGVKADSAIPMIVELLKKSDDDFAAIIQDCLVKIGQSSVSELVPLLQDDSVRPQIVQVLLGIGEPALGVLLQVLEDDEAIAEVYASIGDIIAIMGEDASSAVPKLVESLESENDLVRSASRTALRGIGSPAYSLLIDSLDSKQEALRGQARQILSEVGSPCVSELTRTLLESGIKFEERYLRSQLIEILGEIGEPAASSVPTIIDAMVRDVTPMRGFTSNSVTFSPGPVARAAEKSLSKIGLGGLPAILAKRRAFREKGLDKLGNREGWGDRLLLNACVGLHFSKQGLFDCLSNIDDLDVSRAAIILEVNDESAVAIKSLIAIAKSEANAILIRRRATECLGQLGREASHTALVELLSKQEQEPNQELREAMLKAVMKIESRLTETDSGE